MEVNETSTPDMKLPKAAPSISTAEPRHSFLDTVLSQPPVQSFQSFQKSCPYSPICTIPGAFDTIASGVDPVIKAPRDCHTDLFSLPTLPSLNDFPSTSYSIDCNHCGESVPDEHYHCGICENGDFDLCKSCVGAGVTCDGDEHWLVKRHIRNGIVIPSVTTTLPPKKPVEVTATESDEMVTPFSPHEEGERTCNSCILRKFSGSPYSTCTNDKSELPKLKFVTCQDCPDVDLCLSCFHDGQHGHDPSHTFEPQDHTDSNAEIKSLCAPGRGIRHDALCDGCDKVSLSLVSSWF